MEKAFLWLHTRVHLPCMTPTQCVPLSCAALPCSALDKELASLIMDGQIAARIDSGAGVLYARHADARSQTFSRVLATCEDYIRDTKVQRRTVVVMICLKHCSNVAARVPPLESVRCIW
jgi:hypothetical protein